ncbi:MAG: protoporphyrinogen oxidase [Pirellulales bacterium]
MNDNSNNSVKRIAVIGGGISGLAAAHRVHELAPDCQIKLFEASDQLGGVLHTSQQGNFLVEHSADNFITNVPWGVDLCKRVGLEHELLQTNEKLRKAFVVCRGKLEEVPEGFLLMAPSKIGPILKTRILSWRGKARLAWEYFVPQRKSTEDESLRSFVVRRLGKEAYERLVQPLIGGIYTADPNKLSIAATLKQFVEMEREHGCLIRGMRKKEQDKNQSGARYSMFVAPKGGMGALVQEIATRLPNDCVQLNTGVESVKELETGSWEVKLSTGDTKQFDAVIVATPAPISTKIIKSWNQELSDRLAKIPYAGCSVAVLGVKKSQIAQPVAGFGFVVPEIENRKILAASFSSHKFPGRSPDDEVLIRVFVGGACHPELGDLSDEEITSIAQAELGSLIGLTGEPIFSKVTRWTQHMPQYHVGHLDNVQAIELLAAEHSGFELAGNAYRGVGVPQCIYSGEQAAQRATQSLDKK